MEQYYALDEKKEKQTNKIKIKKSKIKIKIKNKKEIHALLGQHPFNHDTDQ